MEEPEFPFVNVDEGRVVLEPVIVSDLLFHDDCTLGTFFRAAAVPQLFDSLDEDIGTPLVCGVCCDTVELDEVDEFEDNEVIDEDELARWALFRGMNILLTSSPFIAFIPPWLTLDPHADLLICGKLGKFATAVIGQVNY